MAKFDNQGRRQVIVDHTARQGPTDPPFLGLTRRHAAISFLGESRRTVATFKFVVVVIPSYGALLIPEMASRRQRSPVAIIVNSGRRLFAVATLLPGLVSNTLVLFIIAALGLTRMAVVFRAMALTRLFVIASTLGIPCPTRLIGLSWSSDQGPNQERGQQIPHKC